MIHSQPCMLSWATITDLDTPGIVQLTVLICKKIYTREEERERERERERGREREREREREKCTLALKVMFDYINFFGVHSLPMSCYGYSNTNTPTSPCLHVNGGDATVVHVSMWIITHSS